VSGSHVMNWCGGDLQDMTVWDGHTGPHFGYED
jgi:hypothetical protein